MSLYTAKEQHLVITAPNLVSHDEISHGFFSRMGGVSKGVYESLNCGLGSNDQRDYVLQNRAYVAGMLGFAYDHLTTNMQIHSTNVITVSKPWSHENAPKADGLVTNVPGILLASAGADCGVLLFYDPTAQVVGTCHAGWRGAMNGIIENTIQAMIDLGGTPSSIKIALGPTIGGNAYEVGVDLYDKIIATTNWATSCFVKSKSKNDKFYFDLPRYIEQRVIRAGVSNFFNVHRCTFAEPEHFFSYRRNFINGHNDYGRHLHGIGLKLDKKLIASI